MCVVVAVGPGQGGWLAGAGIGAAEGVRTHSSLRTARGTCPQIHPLELGAVSPALGHAFASQRSADRPDSSQRMYLDAARRGAQRGMCPHAAGRSASAWSWSEFLGGRRVAAAHGGVRRTQARAFCAPLAALRPHTALCRLACSVNCCHDEGRVPHLPSRPGREGGRFAWPGPHHLLQAPRANRRRTNSPAARPAARRRYSLICCCSWREESTGAAQRAESGVGLAPASAGPSFRRAQHMHHLDLLPVRRVYTASPSGFRAELANG